MVPNLVSLNDIAPEYEFLATDVLWFEGALLFVLLIDFFL
jgi:hypothetical protein